MTRVPLVTDSATFLASRPQLTTSKKEVASSHAWVWRFCQRRLTANPKVATAWPLGVKRNSGSRVVFPISVTLFPLLMCESSLWTS
jgi:hypothetical protein